MQTTNFTYKLSPYIFLTPRYPPRPQPSVQVNIFSSLLGMSLMYQVYISQLFQNWDVSPPFHSTLSVCPHLVKAPPPHQSWSRKKGITLNYSVFLTILILQMRKFCGFLSSQSFDYLSLLIPAASFLDPCLCPDSLQQPSNWSNFISLLTHQSIFYEKI